MDDWDKTKLKSTFFFSSEKWKASWRTVMLKVPSNLFHSRQLFKDEITFLHIFIGLNDCKILFTTRKWSYFFPKKRNHFC